MQVKEKLVNSYANAGSAVVLNIVAATGIVLVLGLLLAPLIQWLKN